MLDVYVELIFVNILNLCALDDKMDFLPILYELDFIGQEIEDLADIAWSNYQIDITLKAANIVSSVIGNGRSEDGNVTQAVNIDPSPTVTSSLETLQSVLTTKQGKYQSLNLHANKLIHLHSLPYLPHLTELNLSSNCITNFHSFVTLASQLPSLTHLDLSANQIKTLEGLPYLSHLKVFSIAFNQIRDVDNIHQSLPNLEELDLRGNFIQRSADLDGLTGLFQLRVLHIGSSTAAIGSSTPIGSSSKSLSGKSNGSGSSGVNTVCHRIPNMIRLFHACESLRTIDDKKLSQWEELFLRYNAAVATPHFDKLAQRYRDNNQQTHSMGGSASRNRGTGRRNIQDDDIERDDFENALIGKRGDDASLLDEDYLEIVTAGRGGNGVNMSGKKMNGGRRTSTMDENIDDRSLSPSKSKVLFPSSDRRQSSGSGRDGDSRSPLTRRSPAAVPSTGSRHVVNSKGGISRTTSRDTDSSRRTTTSHGRSNANVSRQEPEEDVYDIDYHLNGLRLLTALDKTFFHHQQSSIFRAFQHWKVETQLPRMISVIKTTAKIEAESETQVNLSQRESEFLALKIKYDLMIEEKTSLTADYERKLLQEKNKADQQYKKYIQQEGQLNDLRRENERQREELEKYQQNIDKLVIEMEVLRSNFTYQRDEANDLRTRVNEFIKDEQWKNQQLETITEELKYTKDQLLEKDQLLQNIQDEMKTFSSTHQLDMEIINAKDWEIKELRNRVEEKEKENTKLIENVEETNRLTQLEKDKLQITINSLQMKYDRKEEELVSIKSLSSDYDVKCQTLQQEIDNLRSKLANRQIEKEKETNSLQQQYLQQQQKLEQRLLKLQSAFEEVTKANDTLSNENNIFIETQKKDRIVIKDLTKCVKKLQEITDYRTSQDEIVKRIQQEKQDIMKELEDYKKKNHELETLLSSTSIRERDKMKQTMEQLTRLESMVHELERSKKQVETNISVKEVVISDQLQEITEWKDKYHNIVQELTLLRKDYRIEIEDRNDQIRSLEEDINILEEKLHAKTRVEMKMKEIIHNYINTLSLRDSNEDPFNIAGYHLTTSSQQSLSLSQELGLRDDQVDEELVQLLASLEMTTSTSTMKTSRKADKLRKSTEDSDEESDDDDDDNEHDRHSRRNTQTSKKKSIVGKRKAVGIADLSESVEKNGNSKISSLSTLDHDNKENNVPTDSSIVCSNRHCLERFSQLERLVVDYQQALERKSEECEIISDALVSDCCFSM